MTKWHIAINDRIQKQIRAIEQHTALRILKAITRLAHEEEGDVKQLEGEGRYFRLKIGDYRVIFSRDHQTITILLLDVGHRSEIVKRWNR